MNTSTLVQKVWNFCHTLRDDGVGDGDYLEQLTYLLFLKLAHEYAQEPYNRDTKIPQGYDWASLVGAFLACLLASAVTVFGHVGFALDTWLLLGLWKLAKWSLYGLMGLIIIEVVFSWVNPRAPLAPFVGALTDPLLRPLRRIIPLVGAIDLSPIAAFVLIRIAMYLVDALFLPLL